MEKQESDKEKTSLRWFIPLLVTIPFVIWESTTFGFSLKCGMSFIILLMIYNVLITWFKACPEEKPSTLMLIIAIPLFITLMSVVLPPFPYVRPWLVTVITSTIGFELWAFGIGYWVQETKLKKLCTGRTIAAVTGNIKERMDKRTGEVSTDTFYPMLTYTVNGERLEVVFDHGQPRPMEPDRRVEICYNPNKPEEFCFLNQKENKALTFGVPFALTIGTGAIIAAVISVMLKYKF